MASAGDPSKEQDSRHAVRRASVAFGRPPEGGGVRNLRFERAGRAALWPPDGIV